MSSKYAVEKHGNVVTVCDVDNYDDIRIIIHRDYKDKIRVSFDSGFPKDFDKATELLSAYNEAFELAKTL